MIGPVDASTTIARGARKNIVSDAIARGSARIAVAYERTRTRERQ